MASANERGGGAGNSFLRCAAFAVLVVASAAGLFAQNHSGRALVDQYCVACHDRGTASGGLVLEGVTAETPTDHPEIWEQVIRRLAAVEMPPAGMPRPDPSAIQSFTAGLIADLDAAALREPYAGRPVIRRLNAAEYTNAIRDLLAIDLPLADQLPPDGEAAGFDNIGDALSISPLLLEQYLKVARRVSSLAVGVSDPSPVAEVFYATETQAVWQGEGMPFGTRGGIRVDHYFPYDAEYELRAFLGRQSQGLSPTEGARFFRTRLPVKAGQHAVVVTFPDEFAEREGPVTGLNGFGGRAFGGPLDVLGNAVRPTLDFRLDGRRVKLFEIRGMTAGEAANDGQPGPPTLGRIEIAGPYNVSGPGETASRKRIFLCEPEAGNERPCATRILEAITRRAFRRDVSASDIQPFLAAFERTRTEQSFEASIAAALRDILLAPDFLFRLEFSPAGAPPGVAQPVSEFELATRLSFFLWSSIPDDELLDAASASRLREPGELERQVRRMLADRRAVALIDNFAEQWLALRGLSDFQPDRRAYPSFDATLATAFEQETRLFLGSVMRENRSILDILDADYTFVNQRLAENYGLEGVTGPGFRRVSLADNPERGGLLGQGSVLMATSHSGGTSPVLRGTWILNSLLNSPPPPPPPGVPALDESAVEGRKLTTREKVERHRADPACASCHARIDPLGFALENFDVIGQWRKEDDGGAIDPAVSLPNGKTINGFEGLKKYLVNEPEPFVDATVSRLMTYALGRKLDARDRPAIRKVLRSAQAERYRFVDLVVGIVESVPFQMRQSPGT